MTMGITAIQIITITTFNNYYNWYKVANIFEQLDFFIDAKRHLFLSLNVFLIRPTCRKRRVKTCKQKIYTCYKLLNVIVCDSYLAFFKLFNHIHTIFGATHNVPVLSISPSYDCFLLGPSTVAETFDAAWSGTEPNTSGIWIWGTNHCATLLPKLTYNVWINFYLSLALLMVSW